ncbi:MAG: hypothetical protein CMK83_01765 [Pseudomonadales bacterium]|nr:hypothetical protein [Pseudomonadales bacterium]
MRFEELLAHQGPLVHADHSFRLPRQRSAPTEGAESTNPLSQWQKPDLDKTNSEWVDLVGREEGGNNSEARLWGEDTEPGEALGTAKRYPNSTPRYATSEEKKALFERLDKLQAEQRTIDELRTFVRYLNWLLGHTTGWNPFQRTALERAEERSWKALRALFSAIAAMFEAQVVWRHAQEATKAKVAEYDAAKREQTKYWNEMGDVEKKRKEYNNPDTDNGRVYAQAIAAQRAAQDAANAASAKADSTRRDAEAAEADRRTKNVSLLAATRQVEVYRNKQIALDREHDSLKAKMGNATKAMGKRWDERTGLLQEQGSKEQQAKNKTDEWVYATRKFLDAPEDRA